MTKILPCSCSHPYQDEIYGKGNRVHNWARKKEAWRCTVCGTVKGISTLDKEKVKKAK